MSINRLSAWNGTKIIDTTDTFSNEGIYGFLVLTDAVLNTVTGSEGTNLITELNLDGTLPADLEIFFPLGKSASTFKLTSGSVLVYRA